MIRTDERPKPLTFEQSVARRVRQLRKRHGFSQQDLADKLRDVDMPIDRSAIARLETGKRAIGFEEAICLAVVLDVAPVHLFVDPDGDDPLTLIPGSEISPDEARKWIRGREPIPSQDRRSFFSHVPETEFEDMGGVPDEVAA